MVAACVKFVIFENVRYDDPEPLKTSPSITLSQLRAILHSWFHFGRNTRYFQSCGRIDKGSVGQKYPVFLPKRNQVCRIVLSCDKVIPGEIFRGSGSSYLTFSKITNFIHAATTEFKLYVIMKWAIEFYIDFNAQPRGIKRLSWNFQSELERPRALTRTKNYVDKHD